MSEPMCPVCHGYNVTVDGWELQTYTCNQCDWKTSIKREPPEHGPGLWICSQWGGRMDVAPNERDYVCLQSSECPLSKGDNPMCHLLYQSTAEDYAREARIKAMWEGL